MDAVKPFVLCTECRAQSQHHAASSFRLRLPSPTGVYDPLFVKQLVSQSDCLLDLKKSGTAWRAPPPDPRSFAAALAVRLRVLLKARRAQRPAAEHVVALIVTINPIIASTLVRWYRHVPP